jgi:hypothetical protein
MLVIWQTLALPHDQLNMYNTDHEQDRYCLLYYVHDFINYYYQPLYIPAPAHQVIPYCLRPLSEENFFVADVNFINTNDSMFSFAELKEKNISSQMLLSWSIPIDLIERYEIFLNDRSISSLSPENEILIHNCTWPWFGPLCRFKFDAEFYISLKNFVRFIFLSKSKLRNITQITCYIHLNCTTNFRCLDWREICDGKIDCIDESDEWNCWQLEMNECVKNEYRCRNGQCIPDKFYHDVPLNPDCLDGTDERHKDSHYPYFCSWDPTFRCEERTCRPGKDEFPCGDGTCTTGISNCFNGRDNILLDNLCSIAMACLMGINTQVGNLWCKQFCTNISCITDNCPELYEFPSGPVLFGNIRFIYMSKEINFDKITLPKYVCYDKKFYADIIPATVDDIHLNNLSCHHLEELGLNETKSNDNLIIFVENVRKRFRSYLVLPNKTHHCNHSTMYQCMNSRKCISKHYLIDKIQDCPFGDDETYNQSCSISDIYHRIPCLVDNNTICFAPLVFQDVKIDCPNEVDELPKEEDFKKIHIYFQTICDGKTDLSPVLIDERYETDETGCEHWPCNNTYTRCDKYWLCKDGADEVNCPYSTCPQFEHSCVFLNDTSKVSCLPIARAGNGIIDCLGASDEPHDCQRVTADWFQYYFRCSNTKKCINPISLCDKKEQCLLGDDEIFCRNSGSNYDSFCFSYSMSSNGTEIEKFFCRFIEQVWWNWPWPYKIYFKLDNVLTYPSKLTSNTASFVLPTEIKNQMIQTNSIDNNKYEVEWRCNRGLPIHIRMTNDTFDLYCLCPPSYYGDSCQYQNQRVSLTVQIRATSDSRNVFIFAITLIDNENNIESYDYIKYLPFRDCDIKFHIYLLYSTRPKNLSKNYFVRIDAFNAWTLNYRASWIYPIQFSFLPVYRLAVLLSIPPYNIQPIQKCMITCIHGECFNYVNSQNTIFCRCKSGWSGPQCTDKYTCNCAYNSFCISDSICLCSLGRFGSRCHLIQSTCHSQSCYNNGQCIPMDERYISSVLDPSSCICRQEYLGKYCEKRRNQTKINISFNKKLIIPSFIFIHLITIHNRADINRTTTMKKIAFDQYSVSFDISITFNIVFAEIFDNYYLIIVQQKDIVSDNISTEINPSHRCASINELFNTSIINLHLLKRIKYYHLPCKNQHELVCFYDSIHLCLCNLDRQANCFEFDHNVNYNCSVYNLCENGGQCFEDDQKCPSSLMCACFNCYFGSRCQFSTKDSALSLDIILGYRIRPNQRINQQTIVVKVAIALTTVIFCLGLISNILSFLTFRMKNTRSVGCGLYLFTSSIISMITMLIFIIKFWFLLASQTGSINNRLFIQIQCTSIDFLLRFLLSSGDWLRSCVAIERAVTVWKGVNFDKTKSKHIAKWIILIVILFTICTHIHDPLHRYLSEDEEEQRLWCITKYSSIMQLLDWIINIFHFFVPFLFNCISALIVIIIAARVRSNTQKKQPYKKFLLEQFQQHKFLLISPCVLIVLALPRLIISFLFECIKSARDSWFYLIGYFI